MREWCKNGIVEGFSDKLEKILSYSMIEPYNNWDWVVEWINGGMMKKEIIKWMNETLMKAWNDGMVEWWKYERMCSYYDKILK